MGVAAPIPGVFFTVNPDIKECKIDGMASRTTGYLGWDVWGCILLLPLFLCSEHHMAKKRPLERTGSDHWSEGQKSMACLHDHYTDVTFIVGQNQDRYTANSYVMCLQSEV